MTKSFYGVCLFIFVVLIYATRPIVSLTWNQESKFNLTMVNEDSISSRSTSETSLMMIKDITTNVKRESKEITSLKGKRNRIENGESANVNNGYGKALQIYSLILIVNDTKISSAHVNGEDFMSHQISCHFHPVLLSTGISTKLTQEYFLTISFQKLSGNKILNYMCREIKKTNITSSMKNSTTIYITIRNLTMKLSHQESRLICQPTTLKFVHYKYLLQKIKCIFKPSLKTTSQRKIIPGSSNSSIIQNLDVNHKGRRTIHINSFIPQEYFIIVNVSWDFKELSLNMTQLRQNVLLTWEIVSGGCNGNLITNDNFATINLMAKNIYFVQVSLLDENKYPKNYSAFDFLHILTTGSELKVSMTIASTIVNTSELVYSINSNKKIKNNSSDEDSASASSVETLNNYLFLKTNDVKNSETMELNSTPPSENIFKKFDNFSHPQIFENIFNPTSSNSSERLKEWSLTDNPSASYNNTDGYNGFNHTPVVHMQVICDKTYTFIVGSLIFTGIIIINIILLAWLKSSKRFQSQQCSVLTICKNRLCLHDAGCTMEIPLHFDSSNLNEDNSGLSEVIQGIYHVSHIQTDVVQKQTGIMNNCA